MNAIKSVTQGIALGNAITLLKRQEDSVRAGRNSFLTATFQIGQAQFSIAQLDAVLKLTGQRSVPLPARAILCITPAMLAYLTHRGIEQPHLRQGILFAQTHFGTLCHIAAAVSSVALIYFGSPVLGTTSLIFLAIGVLDRRALLPEKVRYFIHHYGEPLASLSGFFTGSYLNAAFSAISLVVFCADKYLTRQAALREQALQVREIQEGALNSNQLQEVLGNHTNVQIHRDHTQYSTLLANVPNIDIGELTLLFNQIQWSPSHLSALRRKLQTDLRFAAQYGNNIADRSNEEMIQFVRAQLEALIHSVQGRTIRAGEPNEAGYRRLEDYLKIIAASLRQCSDDNERVDVLLQLAIDGGQYCSSGMFRMAEDLFSLRIGAITSLEEAGSQEREIQVPFRLKVLNLLQDKRGAIVQALYNTFAMNLSNQLTQFLQLNDIHYFNAFINLYCTDFGMRREGARHDSLAIVTEMHRLFVSRFLGPALRQFNQFFWDRYTEQEIVQTLSEAIGTERLPTHEFYQWWRSWIERQNISDDQKEILLDELTNNATLLGIPLENREHEIDPLFIKAMLVDMGVFTCTHPTSTVGNL